MKLYTVPNPQNIYWYKLPTLLLDDSKSWNHGTNKKMVLSANIPICIHLEPKWPLFWLEFGPSFVELTFKNGGQLGSRYTQHSSGTSEISMGNSRKISWGGFPKVPQNGLASCFGSNLRKWSFWSSGGGGWRAYVQVKSCICIIFMGCVCIHIRKNTYWLLRIHHIFLYIDIMIYIYIYILCTYFSLRSLPLDTHSS